MKQILIVVDMQNDFIDGALGTKEAVETVEKVAAKIEAFRGDILVTYDTHFDNYLDTQEGKNLPVLHCIKGTKGWEINQTIQNALDKKGYTSFEKPTFGSTELAEYIKNHYDTEDIAVELAGLCTDICVVSNAMLLKAYFPEIKISVDASCCAGVTPETHMAALDTMKMCQIAVYSSETER